MGLEASKLTVLKEKLAELKGLLEKSKVLHGEITELVTSGALVGLMFGDWEFQKFSTFLPLLEDVGVTDKQMATLQALSLAAVVCEADWDAKKE
jgi:hypothetical protein